MIMLLHGRQLRLQKSRTPIVGILDGLARLAEPEKPKNRETSLAGRQREWSSGSAMPSKAPIGIPKLAGTPAIRAVIFNEIMKLID